GFDPLRSPQEQRPWQPAAPRSVRARPPERNLIKDIGTWYNGSTAVSKTASRSSNLRVPANRRRAPGAGQRESNACPGPLPCLHHGVGADHRPRPDGLRRGAPPGDRRTRARVAQLVEPPSRKREVVRSTRTAGTRFHGAAAEPMGMEPGGTAPGNRSSARVAQPAEPAW